MNAGKPGRLIAATFALAGFAVAVVAGLGAGNPSARVLGVAIVAMIVCRAIGAVAGAIGERVVREHVDSYRASHPVRDSARTARPIAGRG